MHSSRGVTARRRLLVSLSLGIVGAVLAAVLGAGAGAGLVGWDVLAVTFCVWVWTSIWRMDPDSTSDHARRDDPTRRLADVVILGAAAVSMVAIGAVTFGASHRTPATWLEIALALTSILLSWLIVHTVFTLKYAQLHYDGSQGGIDFNESDPPQYSDFAYLAFTVGMTFQVSDTNIGSKQIRRTVLHHALIAFPLVTLIVASAINLVAGLAH